MATKRRSERPKSGQSNGNRAAESARGGRLRRSDDEKARIVRQILASGNQSAEIKKLGIYPNQFYDWKKKLAAGIGEIGKGLGRRRRAAAILGSSAADEAKAFIRNKSALLERLRSQRAELDQLIRQLES